MTASELKKKLESNGTQLHGDRVLVAREKQVTQTKSGLYLPETSVVASSYGAIVMIGDKCVLPVQIGDSIYVPKYGGVLMEQPVGSETYVMEILDSRDIFLTWRKDRDPELEQGKLEDAAPHLARTHLGSR